jgi:hypothetical protein
VEGEEEKDGCFFCREELSCIERNRKHRIHCAGLLFFGLLCFPNLYIRCREDSSGSPTLFQSISRERLLAAKKVQRCAKTLGNSYVYLPAKKTFQPQLEPPSYRGYARHCRLPSCCHYLRGIDSLTFCSSTIFAALSPPIPSLAYIYRIPLKHKRARKCNMLSVGTTSHTPLIAVFVDQMGST